MNSTMEAFLKTLSFGMRVKEGAKGAAEGAVGSLARVYEIARNALEFRADHLVRRAAIERILRRHLVFGGSGEDVAERLLTELKWAMYVTEVEEEKISREELGKMLSRYGPAFSTNRIDRNWLVGLISAEIEDALNPNNDYHRFTTLAFYCLKSRVHWERVDDLELPMFVAVDRVYSLSDEQQVSLHLYRLLKSQVEGGAGGEEELLAETWRHYQLAMGDKALNQLMAFVRRAMGPLVLLRDMYFANPTGFANVVANKDVFDKEAAAGLSGQMKLLGSRIRTATWRSLLYVFLTKMLVVLVVEVPLDRLLGGRVEYLTMGFNVLIPVAVMWLVTATVRLPGRPEQERLLSGTWQIVSDPGGVGGGEALRIGMERSRVKLGLFYAFYVVFFLGIFSAIIWLLWTVGYGIRNTAIFLFFLTVVSFFAFRIKQTAQIYSFKSRRGGVFEGLMLPIVVAGGWLSQGVSRLNFLVLLFDFVLEAPYKMILKFLDNWLSFLAARKDEAVG